MWALTTSWAAATEVVVLHYHQQGVAEEVLMAHQLEEVEVVLKNSTEEQQQPQPQTKSCSVLQLWPILRLQKKRRMKPRPS